jgi:hypothetical protein
MQKKIDGQASCLLLLIAVSLLSPVGAGAVSGEPAAKTSQKKVNRRCDENGNGEISKTELEATRCEKAVINVLAGLERRFAAYSEDAFQELLKETGDRLEKENQGKGKAALLAGCLLSMSDLVLKRTASGEVGKTIEWLIPDTQVLEKSTVCGGIFQKSLPKVATRLEGRAKELKESITELQDLVSEAGGEPKLQSAIEMLSGLRKRGAGWQSAAERAALNGYSSLKIIASPLGVTQPWIALIGAVAYAVPTVSKGAKDVQEGSEALCDSVRRAHELSAESSWRPHLLKRCLKK